MWLCRDSASKMMAREIDRTVLLEVPGGEHRMITRQSAAFSHGFDRALQWVAAQLGGSPADDFLPRPSHTRDTTARL